ncbi:hypothetical protein CARUB_v10027302mg [Capsella rubella]|uniref:Complex 1 LYR protein n=1 Tax=Capsella rubella TaxID=81985 RepID=R0GP71_9BRAS|nr:hypothetical protein CARUB_v10027302mg [Capsella rubella]
MLISYDGFSSSQISKTYRSIFFFFFFFFFTSDFYFIRSDQRRRESKKMSGEVVLAARVYRDLLKAVVKHIGKEDHKAHFLDFVKQEFRKNVSNSEKMNLARNYAYLLNSIHSHKDLLFSYNIAVDRTEEMKRVLNKSAASVGLRLPEVYES